MDCMEIYCSMFCENSKDLCYWRYSGICNLNEDNVADWEAEEEIKRFMSDWEEYVSEF